MQTKSWFTLGATLLVLACSSSKSQPGQTEDQAPAIVGTYVDDYNGKHQITADSWSTTGAASGATTSVYYITQVDNAQRFLVARNHITNDYYPNMWSQFDWTHDAANVLYYCQVAYNSASEREAAEVVHADANDLSKGCTGFSWSKLTPEAS